MWCVVVFLALLLLRWLCDACYNDFGKHQTENISVDLQCVRYSTINAYIYIGTRQRFHCVLDKAIILSVCMTVLYGLRVAYIMINAQICSELWTYTYQTRHRHTHKVSTKRTRTNDDLPFPHSLLLFLCASRAGKWVGISFSISLSCLLCVCVYFFYVE